jgi:hypothetical protein
MCRLNSYQHWFFCTFGIWIIWMLPKWGSILLFMTHTSKYFKWKNKIVTNILFYNRFHYIVNYRCKLSTQHYKWANHTWILVTNILIKHLGIQVQRFKVLKAYAINKGYENLYTFLYSPDDSIDIIIISF